MTDDAAKIRKTLGEAFRENGNSVWSAAGINESKLWRNEFWVIGDPGGSVVVVNCQATAKLGLGCYGVEGYSKEQARLRIVAAKVIESLGLKAENSLPDQFIIRL